MFEVMYIAGSDNVVADALSCIYSNDSVGTVRARSEYMYHDVLDNDTVSGKQAPANENLPMLAGIEACIATQWGSCDRWPSQKAAMAASNSQPTITPKEFAAKLRGCFVLPDPQTN